MYKVTVSEKYSYDIDGINEEDIQECQPEPIDAINDKLSDYESKLDDTTFEKALMPEELYNHTKLEEIYADENRIYVVFNTDINIKQYCKENDIFVDDLFNDTISELLSNIDTPEVTVKGTNYIDSWDYSKEEYTEKENSFEYDADIDIEEEYDLKVNIEE